ncbi:DMT family transporter [uncultured Kiloniella sp.]|uniref:DMT family transporter n=1 Tax=uncultured Kiloniella sp. TaxID=1133091 RepID=UPI00260B1CD7|nr:DMT family transporter [uncultured Kiloniella sp.]
MTASINTAMGAREWLMLIILSILWGGSFFFVGVAVSELPPFTIVTFRVGLAAIALWTVIFALKMPVPKTIKAWSALLAMGILNNVIPFTLIVWGQIYIPSGLASILNATTPLFGVIVATLFLPDEKATILKALGVIVGFFGVVLMFGLPDHNQNLLAQLAILGATLSYAFAGVFGRRFKTMAINPIVTAAGQVTGATFLLFPITYAIEGMPSLPAISNETWASLVALALLSTAVAYILYFKILERAGATNLLLVTLLVPVSAILLGALFLDEKLDVTHFIGMAFIAIGLSAIDGRLWRKLSNKNRQKTTPS